MAHARGADITKRQIVLGHVQQGVVEADATGVGLFQNPLLLGPVVAKVVERQGAGALIDV
ncbi:hypothetical protein D3C84_605880 [compost metagenome]